MTAFETAAGPAPAPAPHFFAGARPVAHQRRRARTVLRLAAGLSGDALDYGAGWGDLTARLAPQFRRIVGADVSAERTAFAAREYAPIEFVTCEPDRVDFPDASFDVVFSIVVLHFTPSPEQYLAECHRLLRPAGYLVVMTQNPESMWMTAHRMRRGSAVDQRWGGSTRAEFRAFLERGGFVPELEAGFYDPAFDHVRRPADLVHAMLNLAGHTLSIPGRWSYVGYRCRRTG